MKKVRSIFLCIGIIMFAISLIAFTIDSVTSAISSYRIALKDDIYGSSGEWFWIFCNIILIPIPFLLSEISLIKNSFVILTKEQPKVRKISCCFSSVLALFVIIMIILVEKGIFKYAVNYYAVNNRILFALWPVLIVSFVLGRKQKITVE